MKIKIQQIAIYVPDPVKVMGNLIDEVGADFYQDNLKMDGITKGKNAYNIDLNLFFCHGLMDGVELELINSKSASHWHREKIKQVGNIPFLSHLGMYCTAEEYFEISGDMRRKGFSVLQDTVSKDHSNKRKGDGEKSSRSYMDVIFDSENQFGFNLKLSAKAE